MSIAICLLKTCPWSLYWQLNHFQKPGILTLWWHMIRYDTRLVAHRTSRSIHAVYTLHYPSLGIKFRLRPDTFLRLNWVDDKRVRNSSLAACCLSVTGESWPGSERREGPSPQEWSQPITLSLSLINERERDCDQEFIHKTSDEFVDILVKLYPKP